MRRVRLRSERKGGAGVWFITPMVGRLRGLGYLGFDTTFTSLVRPCGENWQRTLIQIILQAIAFHLRFALYKSALASNELCRTPEGLCFEHLDEAWDANSQALKINKLISFFDSNFAIGMVFYCSGDAWLVGTFLLPVLSMGPGKGGKGGVHNFTTLHPLRPSAFAGCSW